jgi:hypothetical protein
MAQASLWKDLIINMSRVPQVLAQYDLGRIFGWVAHLAGIKNVNQFKIQAQVLQPGQAPTGNVVPIRPNMLPPQLGGNPATTGIQEPTPEGLVQ